MSAQYSSPALAAFGGTELVGNSYGLDAHGVAWHYGNPLTEQRDAREHGGTVDRSHRQVLHVHGPEAAVFLNNLLSQKLDDVPIGYAASALDLDIHGHILHHVDLISTPQGFYLDTTGDQAKSLEDFLRKMVFWSKVDIEAVDLAIITVLGPAALPELNHAVFTRSVDWPKMSRVDIAVPRKEIVSTMATLQDAGITPTGLMAFTAERVRAMEPEKTIDCDARTIAHEIPPLIGRGGHRGAVHLNKGCYRGQETVARVENLGQSPRLMVRLLLDGSAPQDPTPGTEVLASVGGRTVGRLGTVVHDYEYGPVALALVKRSALRRGEVVVAPNVAAAVDKDSLPTDEGEKAGRAALERLRKIDE